MRRRRPPRPSLFGRIVFTEVLEHRMVLDCVLSESPDEFGIPVALSLRTAGDVPTQVAELLGEWADHDRWVRIDVERERDRPLVAISTGRSRLTLGMDYGGAGLGV